MLPDIEPPPVWTPLISWSHPRVWLREAVEAFSAWLNKPTKAERADTEAWLEKCRIWSTRSWEKHFQQIDELNRRQAAFDVTAEAVNQRFMDLVRSSFPEPPASQPGTPDMDPETPSAGS